MKAGSGCVRISVSKILHERIDNQGRGRMGSKNKNRTKIIGAAAAAGAALGYTAVCNQLFDFTVARKSLWSYGGKKKKDGKAKAVPLDRYGRIPEQDQEWLKNREQDELEICSTVDDLSLIHISEPTRPY